MILTVCQRYLEMLSKTNIGCVLSVVLCVCVCAYVPSTEYKSL